MGDILQRTESLVKHWFKRRARDIEEASGFTAPTGSPSSAPISSSPTTSRFSFPPNANGIGGNPFDGFSRAEATKWVPLPPGGDWAFHAATPTTTSASSDLGYFHHFSHRLTTAVNIFLLDHEELLKDFKELPKYDEYTEIVLVGPKRAGVSASDIKDNDPRHWKFCFVDHFNRKVMTQEEFEKDPNDAVYVEKAGGVASLERPYREWMSKKQCLGRKIAQQIVWDYQTTHVVKDIDIEGSFSISDCSSLLSALQKKRVSDKQCQKMIKAVIQRFLRVTVADDRPKIGQNFSAEEKINQAGSIGVWEMALFFLIWTGPMLHVPFAYFRRLRLLAIRADAGEFVPDLWQALINGLLKEWSDLNIVLALILSANVAFLALPGTSGSDIPGGKSEAISDASRAAGIISMFMTMSGLLTSISLIWLHSPLSTTGTSDAYKYILGPIYKVDTTAKDLKGYNSFTQLARMATFLAMPLVLLVWSVLAFVVSATTWIFLFSKTSTQIATLVIGGAALLSPLLAILVFRRPTMAQDNVFPKSLRGQRG